MYATELRELLAHDLMPLQRRLHARLLDQLAQDAQEWVAHQRSGPLPEDGIATIVAFCKDAIGRSTHAREALEAAAQQFEARYRHAGGREERAQHLLDFSLALGADPDALAQDQRALSRWLDRDALMERYHRRLHEQERLLAFVLERLGALASQGMRTRDPVSWWQWLQLETLLLPVMAFDGDPRVRIAAFGCLAATLRPHPDAAHAVSAATTQYVFRFALDARQPLWLQCEALDLVATLAPQHFVTLAGERLDDPAGSDLFLRRRLVRRLAPLADRLPEAPALLRRLARDPSEAVRQAVATSLPDLPTPLARELAPGLRDDPAGTVRGMLATVLPDLMDRHGASLDLPPLLDTLLSPAEQAFVVRATLQVLPALLDARSPAVTVADLEARLTRLHLEHPDTPTRRRAAQARERLWARNAPASLCAAATTLPGLAPGARQRVARDSDSDGSLFARLLAVQAQQDFGFSIGARHVRREFRPVFRLWRFLHEYRTPATGKRQNVSHVSGRAWDELLQAPSQCVAEMSETRVPGEPLHLNEEGGWRPYLPLVDQVISCLDQGWPTQPLRIVTAEGTTLLTPPAAFLARLHCRWRLTRDFAHYAALRNWTPDSPHGPDAYLAALVTLGFRVSLETHPGSDGVRYPADPRVARFFPAAAVLPPSVVAQWNEISHYFYSVYQNTLSQLLVFCIGIGTLFLGNHLWQNIGIRRARARIPLVIGGWGTRGKSGTERLKAALFSALGSSVVSKTTGCEAMFLHGSANQPLREMFLFRPYDKATIWEQAETTRLAARLGADVFLWECMALNPRYVDILQHQWMHDDVATITNCFPDHEDVQGPSGVDIPQVMTGFVPHGTVLLTSEENMLPFLAQAAQRNKTRLVTTGWLSAGLLPADILARFPYQEHPHNIALTLCLADELGLDRDFALAEMADRVVPDLGVLKVYPRTEVDSRRLEFINGMSANERLSTLENWRRTGMDAHTPEHDPGTWLAVVVNNRADRIARSQVFADIVVRDLSADRFILIGSNLDGLRSYIDTSLDTLLAQLEPGTPHAELLRFADGLARRWRVIREPDTARARLAAMLEGLRLPGAAELAALGQDDLRAALAQADLAPAHGEAVIAQLQADLADCASWQALAVTLGDTAAAHDHLMSALRAAARAWLDPRLVIHENMHSDGNGVVRTVVDATPPGLFARVMGVQNIKGTGLDFVYRWQAWDRNARLCRELAQGSTAAAANAAHLLAKTQDFGLLDELAVRAALARAKERTDLQTEAVRNDLDHAGEALDRQLQRLQRPTGQAVRAPVWLAIVDFMESFLDAGSSVGRRRVATQVYEDLAAERISAERASLELMQLNRAQGQGWLRRRLGLA